MFKRFIVENFSSYHSEMGLDMTAGRAEQHKDHVVSFKKVKILKSAVVYGANASGKSNLVRAIDYAKEVISNGLEGVDTYKKYFRLDSDSAAKPSRFEFELELGGRFFSYGFSAFLNKKKISEEWLFEIGKNLPEMIFERGENNSIVLGKLLKKKEIKNRFEIYADDMKNQSDQLFLTEIADKELDIDEINILNNIYNWFSKKVIIVYPDTQYGLTSSIAEDATLSRKFRKYLHEFDTGVVDIFPIEEDFERAFQEVPVLRKDIEKNFLEKDTTEIMVNIDGQALSIVKNEKGELKVKKLGLIHNPAFKDPFELKDESDGTQRLFDLIPLINYFSKDYTIIIDEFDRSLHPKLARKLFELFYKEHDSKSQLIVTTHESNLLDLDLVRRDEIWFTEKNKNGASNIFSLNQFKVRYDVKVKKAYLLGRYGAVPIFKHFDEIDLGE